MTPSILALALMTVSAAQTSAPTSAGPAAGTSQPAARRVCRLQERVGTILTRRVCRSSEEWAAIDQAQGRITDRDTQQMRDHARASMREPGVPGT